MHRYDESLVARVRTDYLHMLQKKYESEITNLQMIETSSNSTKKDIADAKKKIKAINVQIEECREYDELVA